MNCPKLAQKVFVCSLFAWIVRALIHTKFFSLVVSRYCRNVQLNMTTAQNYFVEGNRTKLRLFIFFQFSPLSNISIVLV